MNQMFDAFIKSGIVDKHRRRVLELQSAWHKKAYHNRFRTIALFEIWHMCGGKPKKWRNHCALCGKRLSKERYVWNTAKIDVVTRGFNMLAAHDDVYSLCRYCASKAKMRKPNMFNELTLTKETIDENRKAVHSKH